MFKNLCWFLLVFATSCGQPDEDVELTAVDDAATENGLQGGRASNAHPAVGLLIAEDGSLCTGSLIGPRLVLTAAHCVDSPIAGFYTGSGAAVVRGDNVNIALDAMDAHAVADQAAHPRYQSNLCGDSPDVALVLLAKPIDDITPIPVARIGAAVVGSQCSVVGFGRHGSGASRTTAQKRSGTSRVEAVGPHSVEVTAVTALADHGDSGGPLLCNSRIRGITSCGPDGPWKKRSVAYARVEPVKAWMDGVKANWGV